MDTAVVDTAEGCAISTQADRAIVVEVRSTAILERGVVARALEERLGPTVRVRTAENVAPATPADVVVDLRHIGPDVAVSVSQPSAGTAPLGLLDSSVRLEELVRQVERATGVAAKTIATLAADGGPRARRARSLTDRELEVLQQLRNGHCNKVIAANLGISVHTVRSHVESIMKKTGTQTRVKAVMVVT